MKKKMLISAAIMLCLCMVACGGTKEAAESGVTTDTEGIQVPAETSVDTDNTDDTAKESEEQKMTENKLFEDYSQNVALIDKMLNVGGSFDMLSKKIALDDGELTLYFIDGFAKDTVLQKLMMHIMKIMKQ